MFSANRKRRRRIRQTLSPRRKRASRSVKPEFLHHPIRPLPQQSMRIKRPPKPALLGKPSIKRGKKFRTIGGGNAEAVRADFAREDFEAAGAEGLQLGNVATTRRH